MAKGSDRIRDRAVAAVAGPQARAAVDRVADSSNRVGFYFPGLQAMNGGNFLPSFHLAPGMFAAV